jgi:F-type H+-transporting ATPase subunit epsilon
MADAFFTLRVLSPLGTVFEGKARSATLPTAEGEIMILAHHMPMVSVLVDGEMRVDTGQKVISIAIAGGFLDTSAATVPGGIPAAAPGGIQAATAPGGISAAAATTAAAEPVAVPGAEPPGAAAKGPDESLPQAVVLSDFAAESDSIEVARAEAAKARAEELLSEKKDRADTLMVERDLQRAILQLKIAEKVRKRRPS